MCVQACLVFNFIDKCVDECVTSYGAEHIIVTHKNVIFCFICYNVVRNNIIYHGKVGNQNNLLNYPGGGCIYNM